MYHSVSAMASVLSTAVTGLKEGAWQLSELPALLSNELGLHTWCQHPHHLLCIRLLIWHVLSRFAGPHQVKAVICKLHLQGIHNLEGAVGQALLVGQRTCTRHLLG